MTPYTPDAWTADQRRTHTPSTLDEAFYWASCLAGGYYHRPVTIDSTIVGRDELYRLRPHDATPAEGYWPVYTVTAHERRAS